MHIHNMDRLYERVASHGPVCVGLDTAMDYIPPVLRETAGTVGEALFRFNQAIIEGTRDYAACYKVQIAYYEALGLEGLTAYARTLSYLRQEGLLTIADIKRGDIADTALQYARAHFEGDFEADFVTLSPYMGLDTLEPWLTYGTQKGKGAFVLMRTSNKGMRDFEYQRLEDGRRLYTLVGDRLGEFLKDTQGSSGYAAFGVVVGCTEPEEAETIRLRYPQLFFLIPGYGAQGGAAEDAARLLQRGNGGVVNASRSILKAWLHHESAGQPAETVRELVCQAAGQAAKEMRDAIREASMKKELK
ncbi:MAG TPA: orotidine-5'-phosphate decarboxylase [Termitinemataceae bacterium]|nr:orotidine-5'-phosphate decarboxylase [Termitinemataceae bacterium]HOM22325.1 orotidine-5'-phosphate decarboxylase [Termitinemataceae bacterium]HPP99253.1 orotidine-5'-phosphate decarboxylase [Termitinemataceae bacterium]